MKDQNVSEEVMKILQDVPNARKALLENYENLLNVAEYCYSNYIQVSTQYCCSTTATVLLQYYCCATPAATCKSC